MKKKIIAIGVSLCCVLSLIPVWPRNEVMAVEKNASFLGLDDVAPLDFNQADTLNPYGINEDEKKLLLTQNELLTFVSTRNASNDAYNKTYIKNGINTDSLSEDSNHVLTKSDTLHSETQIDSLSSSSFVKAVAFDATGSGRKNYVANLSVARINNDNKVFLTVHKIENNTYTNTKGIELGTIDWFGSKGIAECIADNFLQIESGDFNGDGIDELAVYASTDSNPGVRIYDSKLNLKQTMGIYHISYVSDGNSDADIKYKLNCSLASGDFDGNGTTDLAVCTGTNVRGSSSSESLSGSTALVSVWQNMGSVLGKSYQYELSNPQSAGSNKYNVIHSATITMGDVDNDGQDEIIAAGYLNTDVDCSGGGCSNLYDFNDTFFGLCNISIGGSATVELVQMPQAIKSGLKFDHKTNDKIKVPMNVKCVAINGTKSAELVYITGCLYDLSSMSPSLVLDTMGDSLDLYHLGYVKVFSQNATVGVFDDNKAGREQVVFALGVKKPNDNRYSYSIVMIGAKEVDGASKYYYISQNDVLVDENDDLQSAGDGGLNCVPLAVDTDDDGVMVRYSGKGYSYTDPQVTTILQAAPYFSELGTFDDFNNGATT